MTTKAEAAYAQATDLARRTAGVWRKELTEELMPHTGWSHEMVVLMRPGERLIVTKAQDGQIHYSIVQTD